MRREPGWPAVTVMKQWLYEIPRVPWHELLKRAVPYGAADEKSVPVHVVSEARRTHKLPLFGTEHVRLIHRNKFDDRP